MTTPRPSTCSETAAGVAVDEGGGDVLDVVVVDGDVVVDVVAGVLWDEEHALTRIATAISATPFFENARASRICGIRVTVVSPTPFCSVAWGELGGGGLGRSRDSRRGPIVLSVADMKDIERECHTRHDKTYRS